MQTKNPTTYNERIKFLVEKSGKSMRQISIEIKRDIDPTFGIKSLQSIISRPNTEPRLKTLKILATYFKVSIDYFIYGNSENQNQAIFTKEQEETQKFLKNTKKNIRTKKIEDAINEESLKIKKEILLKNFHKQLGFEFD